ncbi:MAG: lipid-A-disaccharide synthase [candidate division Zixibacteria bacterium]|nr:lipid-A-disaccharide synthase [Candidatus Tariuqbacter arcticus]
MKPVLIVAGEPSGDLHAARLVREMKRLQPEIHFFGVGGDAMKAEGVEILIHIEGMSFMGFIEVVKHIPRIKKLMGRLLSEVHRREAGLAILVDYPGFNLRLAEKLKSPKFQPNPKIFYYISPQVWAWGAKRIPKIAGIIDRMAGILPFEVETYKGSGLDFHFVGHPLLDEMDSFSERGEFFRRYDLDSEHPLVALLPGSRVQEVKRILPPMLAAAKIIRTKMDCGFAVGASDSVNRNFYRSIDAAQPIYGDTHNLMHNADLVITASGTATLETAIAGTPMVVVYKLHPLSFQIGKRVVKLKNIALANVVAGELVVPELIQDNATGENIAAEAFNILQNPARQAEIQGKLSRVKEKLGQPGASARAAVLAVEMIE